MSHADATLTTITRLRHRLGPLRLGGQLGIPASTVHAVLMRCPVKRLSGIDRVTGGP